MTLKTAIESQKQRANSNTDISVMQSMRLASSSKSTVSSSNNQFKMISAGAIDIKVTAGSAVNISIYRKSGVTKKLITSKKGVKSYSYVCKYSNSNTYYVSVKTQNGKKCTMTCIAKQHEDKKSSTSGGTWTASSTSPVPSSSVIYLKKMYFSKSQCSEAMTYVSNKKYLDYQSKLANGTLTVTGLIASHVGLKSYAIAADFLSIAMIGKSFDFKSSVMDDIKKKGHYKNGKFGNGVVITEYMYNGVTMIDVQSWTGSSMTGAKGYVGKWS